MESFQKSECAWHKTQWLDARIVYCRQGLRSNSIVGAFCGKQYDLKSTLQILRSLQAHCNVVEAHEEAGSEPAEEPQTPNRKPVPKNRVKALYSYIQNRNFMAPLFLQF